MWIGEIITIRKLNSVNHFNKYRNNMNQVEIARERVSPEGGMGGNSIPPAGKPLTLFWGLSLSVFAL